MSPDSHLLYGPDLTLITPSPPASIDLSPYPTRRASQPELVPSTSQAVDARDPATTSATTSSAVAALLKTSRTSSPLRNEAKAPPAPPAAVKPVVRPQRGRSPAPSKVEASDGEAEDDDEVLAIEQELAALPSEDKAARALSRDIGVVMRTRAERGYGLHDVSVSRT